MNLSNHVVESISKILGYQIKNKALLKIALTRKSAIAEKCYLAADISYQRLEFIGDSILNLIITKLIYLNFLNSDINEMFDIRKEIISNKTLGALALKLDLGKYLIIGNSEEVGDIRTHSKALADLMESLIGMIYFDCGQNFEETQKIVFLLFEDTIKKAFQNRSSFVYYSEKNWCYIYN